MKKIIFILGILLITGEIQAQEVTRGQVMDLFYKAQKAEKSNNKEEAIAIYKAIISVDPSMPTPYLKLADIYASDESGGESVATAISLYNKYLSLQPNDENTPVIKNKVAQLQKLTVNSQSVNLTDILHINQEQAQTIFATKARPGLKAANKEELNQQVEDVTALYNHVQEAVNNNDIESGTRYAGQLLEQSDPTSPMVAQTNMMLVEIYGKQGDMQKMQDELVTLEENMAMYKQLQQYYNTTLKDALPFEDDICGIWVSDLAYEDATPFLALEIQKDDRFPQKYNATLLPYCTLAEKQKMYTGKPFNYEAKYSTNTHDYFACSSTDSVHLDTDMAYFYFGNRKFSGTSTGVDEFIIKPAIDVVGEVTKASAKYVATDLNRSYANAQITAGGIEIIGAIIQFGLTLATVKTNKEISFELNMQRLFAGCADINLVHNTFVTKTTGSEKESTNSMQMRIYKLYPEDKILFAANGNELFGYKTLNKEEILKMEEYEHLQVLKTKSYFNSQAYKKLSEKISEFCFSKASEEPSFNDLAADCRMRFEYATQGLSYQTFKNKDGFFEGWADLSGKMNGLGKCTLNNGTTYIGNWSSNKYSGEGKITFRDKTTQQVTQEYTGTFKNNKYHGKGLLKNDAISYNGEFADGVFEGAGKLINTNGEHEGTWKKGKPETCKITYTNGDRYEGQCAYNKKTEQIERQGQGVMAFANGELASGKWKNNELVTKK